MQWDTWYELAVRELCELTDPTKGRLAEARETEMAEVEEVPLWEPRS